jgi:hypothetical protein
MVVCSVIQLPCHPTLVPTCSIQYKTFLCAYPRCSSSLETATELVTLYLQCCSWSLGLLVFVSRLDTEIQATLCVACLGSPLLRLAQPQNASRLYFGACSNFLRLSRLLQRGMLHSRLSSFVFIYSIAFGESLANALFFKAHPQLSSM